MRRRMIAMAVLTAVVWSSAARAEDAPSSESKGTHPHPAKKTKPAQPAKKADAPPPPSPPPPATAFAGMPDFTVSLKMAGSATCATQVNETARAAMAGVAMSNTISSWAPTEGKKRLVSVAVGQRYNNPDVPYGATEIVAAPNPAGTCDTVSVQAVPSPMPCDKIRTSLPPGKAIANLAGVVVLQDEGIGQTMLVPTAANTCMLIDIKPSFAK